MNYVCLTCGFSQDFEPTRELVDLHHPWMKGRDANECPSCRLYLVQHGGRKNDKKEMPDIVSPGILEACTGQIKTALDQLNADFNRLTQEKDSLLESKYDGEKIFGFSLSDLDYFREKKAAKEARRR